MPDDILKREYDILLNFHKPRNFNPKDKENCLLQMEKNYHKTLISLRENHIIADNFSMFEFRNALEHLHEQSEKYKEKLKK